MSLYVTVKDSNGKEVLVKVSLEVYELFDEERKYNARIKKEAERHYDGREIDTEIVSYLGGLHKPQVDEQVIYRSEIRRAEKVIRTCTQTQQKRFYLNRILNYSFVEIAMMENCSETAAKKSVKVVSDKLKNFFQK